MENIQYSIDNKYIVISQNRIQSRKYMVNKITIGYLTGVTDKSLIFRTDNGMKYIRKETISQLIDISNISFVHTQFFIEKIEGALV